MTATDSKAATQPAADWVLALTPVGTEPRPVDLAMDSARYALDAVEHYALQAHADGSPLTGAVEGLLADLMHLADTAGFDFADVLNRAADAYEQDLGH